jgi:hypothetical protein
MVRKLVCVPDKGKRGGSVRIDLASPVDTPDKGYDMELRNGRFRVD